MVEPPVRYLPSQLAADLENWAPPEISGTEIYGLQRLAERIYAVGYDDGHRRGTEEGRAYQRRPKVDQVKELRTQLKARTS